MNPIDTERELSPSLPAKRNRRRWVSLVITFLMVPAGLWFLVPNPALAPQVTLLPVDYSIQSPPTPIPDRWIPMKWGWLWRLRYALLGRPAVIEVTGDIVRLADTSISDLTDALDAHSLRVETNGARAWILPEDKLREFREGLNRVGDQLLSGPRLTSGHAVHANLQQTTTASFGDAQFPVGMFFNCLTLARGNAVELTMAVTHSEAVFTSRVTATSAVLANATRIHTNLHLAAKLQLPSGFGAFLMETNHADPAGRRVGIYVNAKVK